MNLKDKLRLKKEELNNYCSMCSYNFETTEDLEIIEGIIGQERAKEALKFGLDIRKKGFNIYVAGQWGTGRTTFLNKLTRKIAANEEPPVDYIYANNFEDTYNPIVLKLKNGEGKKFINRVYDTISFLRKEIDNYFSGKEYENQKKQILLEYKKKTEEILEELNEIAQLYDFKFQQTDKGIVSIPLINGEVMSEEEYNDLSDEEYEEMKENSEKLQVETADLFNEIREVEKDYRNKIQELNKNIGRNIVSYNLMPLRKKYKDNESVIKYLDLLEEDIIKNISNFIDSDDNNKKTPMLFFQQEDKEKFFDRYKLNLFIDNSKLNNAPVVFETNPTYQNLLGKIEYTVEMGVRRTDFRHIKPGALHRANGGYLILLAKDLLSNPFAWKGLKRALLDEHVTIESMFSSYTAFSAETISPEPIDLDVKVVVIGDPRIYHILALYDEEFGKLFKVRADFDYENDRNDRNVLEMAQFINSHCQKNDLRPVSKDAVGKVIEHSSRLASDKTKISAHLKTITDIIFEADNIAKNKGEDVISIEHIVRTLEARERRDNRYEEKIMELFEDDTYLLDVTGKKIGEINGLAVISTGQHTFGKPNKITASTFKGKAGIINIEREVRTSGSIHDKGVLILSGYMGHVFGQNKNLAFTASIVFEQLYSGVEGDSASSTELYAILSSLAGVPIDQSIAVTGSVNQRGQIQPIGGVNEKIEGFYKVCKLKGLTGNQGVIIPKQNVKNLVLKDEVIEAVESGDFSIYAIEHIDEGIEILTGLPAGRRTEDGEFTEDTIFGLVDEKLNKFGDNDDSDDDSEETSDEDDENK